MNVMVNDSTKSIPLIILLLIMQAISLNYCVGLANRAGGDQPTLGWCEKDDCLGDSA
jgi:hypothetical protein